MFVQLSKEFLGHKPGERIDLSAADADHLIREGVAQPLADDPLTPLITRAIQENLEGAVEQTLQKFLQKHDRKVASGSAPFTGLGTGAIDDPRASFKSLGEFALAVKDACQPGKRPDDRLLLVTKAASGLGEAAGSDGGFLVPPEFSRRLLERVYAQENLLARTDGYTVAGSSITFPRSAETSRANGSRWGGVRAYWREEGDQATASKPTFGRLQLNLHKLFVLVYASEELLSDAGGLALEQYLLRVATDEIGFVVGDAIINGTGAGQPAGILNTSCLITVTKEAAQPAATVKTENVVKMWSRLWAPCRQNAIWLVNQDVEPQLHTMTLSVGSGGVVTYMPPGGLSGKPYATLLGRPVVPVEWCSTLGTAGDIILADLRHYVTITKGMIDHAMSIHLRFDYDESSFRFTFRVDGQPWWSAALTPYKGTATQSCFVTLETRS
jgi:HK97 family phage major capsid protein